MNETQSNRDVSDIGGWGFYSVITVSFEVDDKAHDALMLLKQLDSQHQVGMDEAVLILREADGRVVEMDRVASAPMPNTVGGGLVGLLVGIIGGPLGILIGGTTGSLVGTLFDFQDADKTESALTALSSAVRLGHTALLAVVKEQNRDVVDTAMSGLGGTVLRRPVHDVEAEIGVAEQAEREAKHEARKESLRGRHERDKRAVDAKVANRRPD